MFPFYAAARWDRLEIVPAWLQQEGLKCKLEKCAFFQREVKCLGHVISSAGVTTGQALSQDPTETNWFHPGCTQEEEPRDRDQTQSTVTAPASTTQAPRHWPSSARQPDPQGACSRPPLVMTDVFSKHHQWPLSPLTCSCLYLNSQPHKVWFHAHGLKYYSRWSKSATYHF